MYNCINGWMFYKHLNDKHDKRHYGTSKHLENTHTQNSINAEIFFSCTNTVIICFWVVIVNIIPLLNIRVTCFLYTHILHRWWARLYLQLTAQTIELVKYENDKLNAIKHVRSLYTFVYHCQSQSKTIVFEACLTIVLYVSTPSVS